jgi:hypothetical protein
MFVVLVVVVEVMQRPRMEHDADDSEDDASDQH